MDADSFQDRIRSSIPRLVHGLVSVLLGAFSFILILVGIGMVVGDDYFWGGVLMIYGGVMGVTAGWLMAERRRPDIQRILLTTLTVGSFSVAIAMVNVVPERDFFWPFAFPMAFGPFVAYALWSAEGSKAKGTAGGR